ncbi:coth-domain-containing protein [Backusella circina FSU 941]|nr:coth-domain-containing protein [Backusella circina FSU 941]
MGVIVDDQVYPLSASKDSSLLHTGKAPIAKDGYSYTLLDNKVLINPENFTREPVEKDTDNEYYNRTWNKWNLDNLPIVLPSLPIVDRKDTDLHIDGQIPTIHLIGNETDLENMHENPTNESLSVLINMTYISLEKVKNFDNVTLQISGHSTRMLSKLSYKINIPKKQDLFGYRRLKFRSLGTDPSYMRENLVYDMYNSVGLPTSQYSYVRIYMNDGPLGIYGLAENLKNPWVRNEFAEGDKDFTQGALYVADISGNEGMGGPGGPPGDGMGNSEEQGNGGNETQQAGGPGLKSGGADLSFLGNNVSLYSESGYYSLKEKPSNGEANYTRIMDLTKFISDASNVTTDNLVVPAWEEKMDTVSFLRGMAMEILTSNSDGYFTMPNNYVLYDDLENERLIFSGSDFDLTMGHGMYNVSSLSTGNYSEFPGFDIRPLPKMLNVPIFKEEFDNLLINITRDLISSDVLMTRIDQLTEMLANDVEWDRSCVRKGSGNSPVGFGGQNGTQPEQDKNNSTMPPKNANMGGPMSSVDNVPFISAVNGPVNDSNSLALKEWIELRNRNIVDFYKSG